jgi:DNA-directed RNA polymerase subunit RPC12/RpoP
MSAGGDLLSRSPVLTLLVLCHRCGREFPSDVSLSEEGIRGPLMDGVVYECPHCGTRDPYFTAEHYLPGSGGFAAVRSPGSRWLKGVAARPAGPEERRSRAGA